MMEKIGNIVSKILELERLENSLRTTKNQIYDILATRFRFPGMSNIETEIRVEGTVPLHFNHNTLEFEQIIDVVIKFDGIKMKIYDKSGRWLEDFYFDELSLLRIILLTEWEEKTKILTKCIETVKNLDKKAAENLAVLKEVLAAVKLILK
jgi:DNA repair exonuclease SbcCD ATPase subunit